jgi:hypothetical protein
MTKPRPEDIERIEAQLHEFQSQLDPDGAPILHPWRTAARNSAVALALIGVEGVRRLVVYRPLIANTAWWVWFAVAALAVAVCFGHAALGGTDIQSSAVMKAAR